MYTAQLFCVVIKIKMIYDLLYDLQLCYWLVFLLLYDIIVKINFALNHGVYVNINARNVAFVVLLEWTSWAGWIICSDALYLEMLFQSYSIGVYASF